MSLLDVERSPKHCAEKGFKGKRLTKRLLCVLSSSFSTILSLFLVIWFILRPINPQFYVKDVSLSQISLSSPLLLNYSLGFTLVSRNPNERVGVHYDRLRAYAVYRGQKITGESVFPDFYQGHQDVNLLSASLSGAGVTVTPELGYEFRRDQTAGRLLVRIRLDGRVRWKVGSWVSGDNHIKVDCVAVIFSGDMAFPLSSNEGSECSTSL